MERYVPFEDGEFYHVYNRGIDKRKIFFSDKDWEVFLSLLFGRNSKKRIDLPVLLGGSWRSVDRGDTLVDIVAYALMPNHFHLLVYEKELGGTTTFMRKLLTSYSMYMNKKYDRTGPLMCRPFRAKHVDSDEYFRWLIAYIHANPIELHDKEWKDKGIKDVVATKEFLGTYRFSSYHDYFIQERDETSILNKASLPITIDDLEDVAVAVSTLTL